MKHAGTSCEPYLIGFGWDARRAWNYARSGDWFGVRLTLRYVVAHHARRRSWWGIWQAEWLGCERAVRGFTASGTRRKALRRIAATSRTQEPSS